MFPGVEPTECIQPLNWEDEHELQNSEDCVEKNKNRVGCHAEYFLIKVVLKTVGVDKKVSTKESWHSEAEEETFEIDDSLGEEDKTGENPEPFEQFSVWE